MSSFSAPNRTPGNVSWKTDGSWVTVRWDHVKSMDNESTVQGYKVSGTRGHAVLDPNAVLLISDFKLSLLNELKLLPVLNKMKLD